MNALATSTFTPQGPRSTLSTILADLSLTFSYRKNLIIWFVVVRHTNALCRQWLSCNVVQSREIFDSNSSPHVASDRTPQHKLSFNGIPIFPDQASFDLLQAFVCSCLISLTKKMKRKILLWLPMLMSLWKFPFILVAMSEIKTEQTFQKKTQISFLGSISELQLLALKFSCFFEKHNV